MSDLIAVQNIAKTFHLHQQNKTIHALKPTSFSVTAGEFVGITGKSGSGKSTILKSIYRTYLPQTGSILYDSARFGLLDLAQASERQMVYLRKFEIGYVSQFLQVMPRTTAREIIEQAVLEMGHPQEVAATRAIEMLRHFDLGQDLWDSFPATFSGGEKLRLNLARAMVKHPRLLLLDEPTASLDAQSKIRVRELIERLKSEGTTMIGIFHDIEFMEGLCDREYNMQAGQMQLATENPR
ncbi:MAG: phosphonate C-P lyase system protein PhnL [Eubacteriales bacterium]|nr:phosphonate C-P lyase system protein PhnL [Eubacteriales bacterium]